MHDLAHGGYSLLEQPLDRVLGTQATVRVLRALSNATVPLGRAELIREARVHPSGVALVLRRLEDAGIIESIGRGRSRPLRLRERHPLAGNLRELFRAEAERARQIERNIVAAVQSLQPRPDAAWLEPLPHTGTPQDDAIVVGLLAPKGAPPDWESSLRDRVLPLQATQDIAIEFRVRWRADIETASGAEQESLQHVRPLLGPPPLDVIGISDVEPRGIAQRSSVSHRVREHEAVRYAHAIAKQLATKPDLIDDAVRFIERRLHKASPSEQTALREWHDILTTYSLGRLRAFLTSDTQRARRLRQSMPFVAALSSEERTRVRRQKPATS